MRDKVVIGVLVLAAIIGVVVFKSYSGSDNSLTSAGSSPTAGSPSTGNASSASPLAPAAAGGANDFGPTKQVEIIDPMFNMVAYTMQIPKSWNFEGTVLHGPGCQNLLSIVVYRAYSPDMLYGTQLIPTSNFFWADDPRAMPKGPSCKQLQPMSAEDYGKLVAVSIRPGAVIDSIEVAPANAEFQASLEKNNQQLAAQAAQMGMRVHITMKGEVKRLHIHYDLNGHPEEEWLGVAMTVSDQPTSTIVSKPGQVMQTAFKHVYASSPTVAGTRAPQGQFAAHKDSLFGVGGSLKANPDYIAKYQAWMQEATNRSIAASWAVTNSMLRLGAQEQAQRTQNAQAFIANMQAQGDARNAQFNANMAARDAHTKDVCDFLLDQQLFVNPSTGQTQVQSNQYNHTYSNGTGPGSAVVQTNSPNSNPQGVLAGNWTELQPIHH
jgi:hypothetical protein